MSGPEHARDEPPWARRQNEPDSPLPRPPGEFLTEDLASATARFLEEVKERIHRTAASDRRPGDGRR